MISDAALKVLRIYERSVKLLLQGLHVDFSFMVYEFAWFNEQQTCRIFSSLARFNIRSFIRYKPRLNFILKRNMSM